MLQSPAGGRHQGYRPTQYMINLREGTRARNSREAVFQASSRSCLTLAQIWISGLGRFQMAASRPQHQNKSSLKCNAKLANGERALRILNKAMHSIELKTTVVVALSASNPQHWLHARKREYSYAALRVTTLYIVMRSNWYVGTLHTSMVTYCHWAHGKQQ